MLTIQNLLRYRRVLLDKISIIICTDQYFGPFVFMMKKCNFCLSYYGFDKEDIDQTRDWLRSKANSIEGGTTEVQYNIIAKRVLGLPD